MPIIYLKRTSLKAKGLGFKIIQAKTLNIVLSIKEDVIVDKLFLNHKKRLFVKNLCLNIFRVELGDNSRKHKQTTYKNKIREY